MSLEKKALARIIIFDPQTRRNFWQGTVYSNGIQTPSQVVKKVKQVLGGLEEKKIITKKEQDNDPGWSKRGATDSIESDEVER